MREILSATVLTLAMTASTVLAQTATPRIGKREANQQARIEKGVQSGQLTGKEAAKLERQQVKIRRDEKRAKADGVVTPRERTKLTREQNRTSKNIYLKKHNNRTQ